MLIIYKFANSEFQKIKYKLIDSNLYLYLKMSKKLLVNNIKNNTFIYNFIQNIYLVVFKINIIISKME